MYKLFFFVPEAHLESVKTACLRTGAGKIGSYEKCAWQILGTAQYLPTKESKPYQGISGKLETAREYRVELMVEDKLLKTVMETLIQAHPYESPVYGAVKLLRIEDV